MKRSLLALALALPMIAATPKDIIIDTDVGTDDIMAIAFLLSRSDVSVEAITVVNGIAHVDAGAQNILKLLQMAGKPNIPVYIGRGTPLAGTNAFPDAWRLTSDALPGIDLPPTDAKPQAQSAAEYLSRRLRITAKPLSLVALGPLTNIAEALATLPRGAYPVEDMTIMGGAVRVSGNLEPTQNHTAEWNIYVDPTAARTVFESALRFRLVPLDACNQVPFEPAFLTEFRKRANAPLAKLINQLLESSRTLIDNHIFYAWDPLAAVGLVAPAALKISSLPVDVEVSGPDEGRTAEDARAKRIIRVALDADAPLFRKTFIDAFVKR